MNGLADVAATVLLTAAVLGVLAACVGVWRADDALDGQHFVAAAATVPPVLLGVAVWVREGISSGSVLTTLTVVTVLVTGAATATAFGRAVTGEAGPEEPDQDEEARP